MKRGRKPKVTPEILEQIRRMLKRFSTRQIAYRLGLSQATVWRHSQDQRT